MSTGKAPPTWQLPIARWVLTDLALPLLRGRCQSLSRLSQARRITPNDFLLAKEALRGVLGLCPAAPRRGMESSRRRVMLSEGWLGFESDFPNEWSAFSITANDEPEQGETYTILAMLLFDGNRNPLLANTPGCERRRTSTSLARLLAGPSSRRGPQAGLLAHDRSEVWSAEPERIPRLQS
jgi:hypothetical protein